MEQNYGPEGITLYAATWITVFPGMLIEPFVMGARSSSVVDSGASLIRENVR
jgi:hypothetical protein